MTAFILLLINTCSITKNGLMLSFAAMAGIIFIYPTISKSLISNKKNKGVLNYIKRVISLSISCQITTLPICLYYFGNYSPIFIISNIICIPLTTIIILTFICTITFNYIPFIGNYLAQFTNSILIISINSLNDIVNLI